jgi:hypothetical protein
MKGFAGGIMLALAIMAAAAHKNPSPSAGERHLANIRQLTAGGENAEAYFSFDEQQLVFQSTRPPYLCDQIFTIGVRGGAGLCTRNSTSTAWFRMVAI